MNNLTIESKKPINFFYKGSKTVLGVVEAVIKPVTTSATGDSMSTNYEYYGHADGLRERIDLGPFELDQKTMDGAYEAIKGGIPPNATLSERNLYLYSTILIIEATKKFVEINEGLTTADFQIKS